MRRRGLLRMQMMPYWYTNLRNIISKAHPPSGHGPGRRILGRDDKGACQ